jgi:hypothetical protein
MASTRPWSGQWVSDRLGVGLEGDGLTDLLGLALRRNPKRAHLLVSNVLGKHVPQRPHVVHDTGYGLGRRVRELLGEEAAARAVVLGYAETATGLGHCVADGTGLAPYLHSTRRPVPGVEPVGGFEEEHSHATSHLLLPEDAGLLAGDGPLVLVDDEFSTGQTILNTIRALHTGHSRDRYVVVALVDMRSAADRERLAKLAAELGARVDVVALATGTVTLPADVLERGQGLVAVYELAAAATEATGRFSGYGPRDDDDELEARQAARVELGMPGGLRARDTAPEAPQAVRVDLGWPEGLPDGGRHGFTPAHRDRLEAALPGMAERIATALPAEARRGRVLVLGNEELMYAPLRLAGALESVLDGADVRFSTTTRSPVLAVDDPGYAIRTRISFPAHDSPADDPVDGPPGERYAYNVAGAGFDAVVAVVDSAGDTPGLHALGGLLDRLAAHTGRVLLAPVPAYTPNNGQA